MRWTTPFFAIIGLMSFGPMGCGNQPKEDDLVAGSPSKVALPVKSSPSQPVATNPAGPAKHVGDPCVAGDGWLPAQAHMPPPPGSRPAAVAMHGVATVRRDQLGAGTGFCLDARTAYPFGYFTMNCEVDSDCPDRAVCDPVHLCRRPCNSDSECQSPTTCSLAPGPNQTLRYCWLTDAEND